MLTAAIYSQLSTDTATAAIVGNRIYPGLSPEGLYPLCSYSIKGQVDEAINTSPTQRYEVTITCAALTYAVAQGLAVTVKAALNRKAWTTGTTQVTSCLFEDSDESSFSEDGNPERIYYTQDVTFSILSTETS